MGDITVEQHRAWQDCDLVAAWLDDLRAGRWEDALARVHDDAVLESPASLPHGGQHAGHEGLRLYARSVAQTWAFGKDVRNEVIEAGDGLVLVHTTGRATARATGRTLELDIRTLVHLGASRVTMVRSYWRDTVAALSCLRPYD